MTLTINELCVFFDPESLFKPELSSNNECSILGKTTSIPETM